MKLWVLSQLVGSPGTERVLRAAQAAGHDVELVHPLDLGLVLDGAGDVSLTRGGVAAKLPSVVFTRMGASSPAAGLHVLLQLQQLGVPVINDPRSLWLARDKVRTFQVLAQSSLPLPRTFVPGRGDTAQDVARELGPPPWVVKRPEGSKGEAVFLVREESALAEHIGDDLAPSLVQRFISESAGVDVRVLVVEGKARAAFRRRSSSSDFRSNLHLGGTGEALALEGELLSLARVAERAARALGLEVAGVDLLESGRGPLILEVNGSPGFAGIEEATGLDLCSLVIGLLESRAASPRVE